MRTLPLASLQERSWLAYELAPDSAHDNVAYAYWLDGPLDVAALRLGLIEVVRRHEALRAVFVETADGVVQSFAPEARIDVVEVEAGSEREAEALAADEADRRFDLRRGPALRAAVVRLAPERHLFVLIVHHIVTDGMSMDVILRELTQLYEAGGDAGLPAPTIQYGDFVRWQHEQFEPGDARSRSELAYWRGRLAGARHDLGLPGAGPVPAPEYRGRRQPLEISPQLSADLKSLAGAQRATLFMALLTAFVALLGRWCPQPDIVVATPSSGRMRREMLGVVGLVTNIVLLRTDVSGAPTFSELLRRVSAGCWEDYSHQEFPFELLALALGRGAMPPRSVPLYDAWINLRSAGNPPRLSGLTVTPTELPRRSVALPLGACEGEKLNLVLRDEGDRLAGHLEHNVSVVDHELAARLARDFERVLQQLVTDPEGPALGAQARQAQSIPTPSGFSKR